MKIIILAFIFLLHGVIAQSSSSGPNSSIRRSIKTSTKSASSSGQLTIPTKSFTKTIIRSSTKKTSHTLSDISSSPDPTPSSSKSSAIVSSSSRRSSSANNPTCFPDPIYPPTASPFYLYTNSFYLPASGNQSYPSRSRLNNLPILHDPCTDYFRLPYEGEVSPPQPAQFILEDEKLKFGRFDVNGQFITAQKGGYWDATLFSVGIIDEGVDLAGNSIQSRPYFYTLLEDGITIQASSQAIEERIPITFSIREISPESNKLDIGLSFYGGRFGGPIQEEVKLQTTPQTIAPAASFYGTSFQIYFIFGKAALQDGNHYVALLTEVNNTLIAGINDQTFTGSSRLGLTIDGYLTSINTGLYAAITADNTIIFTTLQANSITCTPADVLGGRELYCTDPRSGSVIEFYYGPDYSNGINKIIVSAVHTSQTIFSGVLQIQEY